MRVDLIVLLHVNKPVLNLNWHGMSQNECFHGAEVRFSMIESLIEICESSADRTL